MIIDTHTHFYDPSRPQGVPWPRPQENLLYRTVLPSHYRALAGPRGVMGTVVVEASPWVEDNQFILDLAATDPLIVGHVGNLDVASPDFQANLERFAANPLYRGIRSGIGVIGPELDKADSTILANVERLVALDLELDLMTRPDGLATVAALARRLPDLRIVLCHVAHVRIDGKAPDAVWLEGLAGLTSCANVLMKVSGMPENTGIRPAAPTDVGFYKPTLDAMWNAFGPERLIYGSNWPVCELFAPYDVVQDIVEAYWADKGAAAQERFFWRNAQAAYKWVARG